MSGGLGDVFTTFFRLVNEGNDTVRVLEMTTQGANGATTKMYVGNRDPGGAVTGSPGQYYVRIDGVDSTLYVHQGAVANNTDWLDVTAVNAGDVVGPASSDDEAITRYDGTTGKLLQNSSPKISDAGAFRDWSFNRIEPAALAADADDYAPAGWDDADVLMQDVTGVRRTITGFAAVTAGAGVLRKYVFNLGGGEEILTLANLSGDSAVANQILCPDNLDIHLGEGEGVEIIYDTVLTQWVVQGRSEEHRTHFRGTSHTAGATENDYAPGSDDEDWDRSDFVTITCPEGGTEITGFDATSLVQTKKFLIAGDSEGIIIRHDNAGSAAGNRVLCPRNADICINQNDVVLLWYDGSAWHATQLPDTAVIYYTSVTVASQEDDFSPTDGLVDWAFSDFLRVTLTGAQTITGFEALATRQRKTIHNTDTTDALTLAHESASSVAENRIKTHTGADIILPPGHSAIIEYLLAESRWVVVSYITPKADTAPVNVSKSAAVIGTSGRWSPQDHKHDVSTAAAVTVAQANTEGTATSLARSDHVHSHGDQPLGDGLDHAVVTANPGGVAGFMDPADKLYLENSKTVTKFFSPFGNSVTNKGSYSTVSVGANGTLNTSFEFPADFVSLVSLEVTGIPVSTFAAQDIDLFSQYAADGELFNTNAQSNTTSTYSGTADILFAIDISGVFTGAAANDHAGIMIDHNAIGTSVLYLGINMIYLRD